MRGLASLPLRRVVAHPLVASADTAAHRLAVSGYRGAHLPWRTKQYGLPMPAFYHSSQNLASQPNRAPITNRKHSRTPTPGAATRGIVLLSPDDVPSPEQWTQGQRALEAHGVNASFMHLSAADGIAAAKRYCEAVAGAGPSWTPERAKRIGLKVEDVYSIGFLIMLMHMGSTVSPPVKQNTVKIGFHMLESAARLGHGPSLVNVMNFLLQGPPPVRVEGTGDGAGPVVGMLNPSRAAKILDVFKNHLTTAAAKRDPNTLTIAGMIAAHEGDDRRALKWLGEAQRIGSSTDAFESFSRPERQPAVGDDDDSSRNNASHPPGSTTRGAADANTAGAATSAATTPTGPRNQRWDLENRALLTLAAIYAKQGKAAEAEAVYRVAAYELDNPAALCGLATVLPPDSAERETCLLRAAASGMFVAGWPLAEIERARAKELSRGADKKLAEFHQLLAKEWERFAASAPRERP